MVESAIKSYPQQKSLWPETYIDVVVKVGVAQLIFYKKSIKYQADTFKNALLYSVYISQTYSNWFIVDFELQEYRAMLDGGAWVLFTKANWKELTVSVYILYVHKNYHRN